MIKQGVNPVTRYLRAYNGALDSGRDVPSMDVLSAPEAARVERFLTLADPEARAYRPLRPARAASGEVWSGPKPEQFALGDVNVTRLQELLGAMTIPEPDNTAISTQPQQGEQQ